MKLNLEFVKEHKGIFIGLGLLLVGYILYRYVKGSSSTAAVSGDLSSEAQFAQLQTAQNVANSQIQGQLDLANTQSQAQIAGINATYSGQEALQQIGADTYSKYLDAQLALNEQNNKTSIDVTQLQASTYIDIAAMQASLYKEQLDQAAKTKDASVALAQSALAKWKNPQSNDIALLISSLQGQGPQAEAAYNSANPPQTSFALSVPGVGSVGFKG